MGEATRFIKTTEQYRYVLSAPANSAELQKALSWAERDFNEVCGRSPAYDDDIWVVGEDDKVIVYFNKL